MTSYDTEPTNTRAFWNLRDNLIQSWLYKRGELRLERLSNLFKIRQLSVGEPGPTCPWLLSVFKHNYNVLCSVSENMLRACIFSASHL
jgi:hypothetical protein